MALGTSIIAIVSVLQPIHHLQKTTVFLITLVFILRQHTKQDNTHGNIDQQTQNRTPHKQRYQGQNHIHYQNYQVQLVYTIAVSKESVKEITDCLHHIDHLHCMLYTHYKVIF